MSTSIFMCLSTEWSSLHHVDEAGLELELKIVILSVAPVRMFSVLGAENSRRVFSAMTSGTGIELPLDSVDSDWKLLVNHYQIYNTLYKI